MAKNVIEKMKKKLFCEERIHFPKEFEINKKKRERSVIVKKRIFRLNTFKRK